MRGVTTSIKLCLVHMMHFNSHASCEAWPLNTWNVKPIDWFQLTRLMRGVTWNNLERSNMLTFQLTRLMRGVTLTPFDLIILFLDFNSHASCEAWRMGLRIPTGIRWFQLTRLMRGVTLLWFIHFLVFYLFQLTRLMRGVTVIWGVCTPQTPYFNSHASCEAWRQVD